MDYRVSLSMAFAIDRNTNGKVDPGEAVSGLSDLGENDINKDSRIDGKELKGIFYEYGKDEWVPADKDYKKDIGGMTAITSLNSIDLKNGKVDIKTKIG